MPNWLQLCEYTAEFTPGAWFAVWPEVPGAGAVIPIYSKVNGEALCVAVTKPLPVAPRKPEDDRKDLPAPERDANARLIADAPQLLVMLASLANCMQLLRGHAYTGREALLVHEEAVIAMLNRHVRVGCAPVEDEARQQPGSEYEARLLAAIEAAKRG